MYFYGSITVFLMHDSVSINFSWVYQNKQFSLVKFPIQVVKNNILVYYYWHSRQLRPYTPTWPVRAPTGLPFLLYVHPMHFS